MDFDSVIPLDPMEMMELFKPLENEDTKCSKFNGTTLPPFFPLLWPFIRKFPIQEEDIVIATPPKAGTTWTQQIVHLIVTGDFEAASQIPVDQRIPFLEFPTPLHPRTIAALAEKKSPRIIKTHLPAAMLPLDMHKGKLIYVYRNAKDVAVSFFYHMTSMVVGLNRPFDKPFEDFARLFMAGDCLFLPYDKNVVSYHELHKSGKQKMLFLRYEDLKADTRGAIRKIAEFLGKPLDDAMLEKIHAATTFEAMQNNDAANYSWFEKVGIWNGTKFIRKGVVGDWRNHFTDPKLLADFDEWVKKSLPEELSQLQE